MFEKSIKKTFEKKQSKLKYVQKQNQEKFYPIQHPSNLEEENTRIFNYDAPARYITEAREVQYENYLAQEGQPMEVQSPPNSRYLELAIIGPPNAGKSSLFNKIIGRQVSAVSNKQSTTFENLMGHYENYENAVQIVLHDTPGITKNYKSSSHYITKAWNVINECKKVIFVVDANRTISDEVRESLRRLRLITYNQSQNEFIEKMNELEGVGEEYHTNLASLALEHKEMLEQPGSLQNSEKSIPKILVINKMDQCVNRQKINYQISELQDLGKFDQVFFVSTKSGYGIDALKKYLEGEATHQDWQFSDKAKSELSIVDQIEQVVKAAVFQRFYHEVPFNVGITIIEFVKSTNGTITITFQLDVDSKVQIGVLAGHQGRNKQILLENISAELMKMYNKEFNVKLLYKTRKHSMNFANQTVTAIVDPKSGEDQVKKEIDSFKEKRQLMAEKISYYLNL